MQILLKPIGRTERYDKIIGIRISYDLSVYEGNEMQKMTARHTIPSGNTEKLQRLHKEICACRQCQESFGFEPHPVVFGNADAKIMQISQAPSRSVHLTGKPFHDASGKRLRSEWYGISDEVFYQPDHFYIVSIAHCYPGKNPGKGDRRPPVSCADQWLSQELALVQNEIYILIGGYAAAYFFPRIPLTELVFQNLTLYGKPAYVLPHPSPLNRKWFQDHPAFARTRIKEIRRVIHTLLQLPP